MLDVNTASTTALIAAMIEAMPEPVLAVAGDGRVMAANRHAKGVLPALKIGGNLALALRDPDILDAVDRVYACRPDRAGVLARTACRWSGSSTSPSRRSTGPARTVPSC